MNKVSLEGKKIWIDIEEPKTGIMFHPLVEKFRAEGVDLLITARDFDSTFNILDSLAINYQRVGRHGGERLEEKLKAYIERLNDLLPIVNQFKPDYFVTFSSIEGARISYGLRIPSIGYNDEPRNAPVCKLIFPFLDKIITPKCVPKEWYIKLHADPEKIIQYNGIDEIGWLVHYTPNENSIKEYNLTKGKYILVRSEPAFASYFIDELKPEETLISKFLPSIIEQFPDFKFIILLRSKEQEDFIRQHFYGMKFSNDNILITRFMPNIVDLCFFSALVISGGGTIVRESSLLGVPSIEFFPGETAPQEHFLINNGFPLEHIKKAEEISKRSIEILSDNLNERKFDNSFKKRLQDFDDPNEICFNIVKENLINRKN